MIILTKDWYWYFDGMPQQHLADMYTRLEWRFCVLPSVDLQWMPGRFSRQSCLWTRVTYLCFHLFLVASQVKSENISKAHVQYILTTNKYSKLTTSSSQSSTSSQHLYWMESALWVVECMMAIDNIQHNIITILTTTTYCPLVADRAHIWQPWSHGLQCSSLKFALEEWRVSI